MKNRKDCCFRLLPKLMNVASSIEMPAAETIKYLYVVGNIDWGTHHHTTDPELTARDLDAILSVGGSVNFYMFHGGTTFGFMNPPTVTR